MNTYLDSKYRAVTVNTLEAMCAHVSGVHCYTFRVEKVTRSRVHVSYSNEDEYGIECPVTAVYPCYESPGIGTVVVLDALRYLNEQDSEDRQYFEPLVDCPPIYRHPSDGKWYEYPLHNELQTIRNALADALHADERLPANGSGLRIVLRSALEKHENLKIELAAELEKEIA